MDPFAEDFDTFFSCMSGNSSSTLGTSAKGTRPPIVPISKGKLPNSSLSSFWGTSATRKRKLGSLFIVPEDVMEGELDPVTNKRISHMTDYFLYSSECISVDMATEADRLDLNERYGRVLKACNDVSAFHSYPPIFSFSSLISFCFCVWHVTGVLRRPNPGKHPYIQEVRRSGV